MEFDAFDVPMEQVKQRFEDCWRILERAIVKGGRFTYEGEHLSVTREIEVRPRPNTGRINFYGAIGSPPTAEKIAKLGLAPLFSGGLPLDVLRSAVDIWERSAVQEGVPTDVARPIAIPMIVADTDEDARKIAGKCVARWFDVQVKHYAHDATRHRDIPDYKPFAEMHQRRVFFTDPNNLDPFIDVCLIGSTPLPHAFRWPRRKGVTPKSRGTFSREGASKLSNLSVGRSFFRRRSGVRRAYRG